MDSVHHETRILTFFIRPSMRKNLPVTNAETKVRDDQYLISKTDMKGRIIYANPAFVEVSGFHRD